MHGMLAAISKTPEMALDNEEAMALAKGIADVAQYYPVNMAPEIYAWINLAMIAVPIYGSRIYLVSQRRREEKMKNVTPQQPAPARQYNGNARVHVPHVDFPDFKPQ